MMRAAALRIALFAGLACGCPSPTATAVSDAGSDGGDAAPEPPAWSIALEHLDGALLSMWGSSPSDLLAVGGPLGNGGLKPLVVRYDGKAWKRLDPGGTASFWWVHGASATDVWMVGEKGRITHYDGTAFKEHASGTTATLFGAWAASKTDAWAVGGTPEGAPNDVLLHWDGTAWTPSPLPEALGRTLFKVWGTSADNVYVVGEAGTIWHRSSGTWTLESKTPLAHGNLVTVNGCSATEVYAVGERDVLRSDGKTWSRVDVTLQNGVNGVACGRTPTGESEVLIVGLGGLKQRLVGGKWIDDFGTVPYTDLHGAWVDATGVQWGVGGNFIGTARAGVSREGVVARYGTGTIAPVLSP